MFHIINAQRYPASIAIIWNTHKEKGIIHSHLTNSFYQSKTLKTTYFAFSCTAQVWSLQTDEHQAFYM